jgi:hypothetical protein
LRRSYSYRPGIGCPTHLRPWGASQAGAGYYAGGEGRPLPVAVIVRRLLAAKGVALPDRRTFKQTKLRLHYVLIALDKRGVTLKVGRGNATRRWLA